MSECMCKVCVYGREVRAHIDKVRGKKNRAFFTDLYDRMCYFEDSCAWKQCQIKDLREINNGFKKDLGGHNDMGYK